MKHIKITLLTLSALLAFLALLHSLYFLTDIKAVLIGMRGVGAVELIAAAITSLALSILANSIEKL